MSANVEILFRRTGSVLAAPTGITKTFAKPSELGVQLVSANRNLESLGYTLSRDFIESFLDSKLTAHAAGAYLANVIYVIRKAVGAHKVYKPMYPNFPVQVIEMDELVLYMNAFVHYFGDWLGVRLMPDFEVDDRALLNAPRFDQLTEIGVATEDDYNAIFTSLLGMKESWGTSDVADAGVFISTLEESTLIGLIPEVVPNKENLGHLVGWAFNSASKQDLAIALFERATTATDVLRIAAGISGSSPALTGVGGERVKFKSFPKAVRRALLNRLEVIAEPSSGDSITEDMLRNVALWKTLAHSLHAGQYADRYPLAYAAITAVRNGGFVNGIRFVTFASKAEALIAEAAATKAAGRLGSNALAVADAVDHLSQRPGEFARRLDKVIRSSFSPEKVTVGFAKVAHKVSTSVLWQLRGFYLNRTDLAGVDATRPRTFVPKGAVSEVMVAKSNLDVIADHVVDGVIAVIDIALREIYGERVALGKVFVSDDLDGFTIPFGARTASKALNPVGRGTRVKFTEGGAGAVGKKDVADTARFFIWWTDGDWRTDIDLSATLMDESFNVTQEVAYYDLRGVGAVHSGDITSAPDGASEFIDINMAQAAAAGARYVAMVINSYTGQPFDTLPEVFAGVMERHGAQSGEIYEPRTVKNIFDVTTSSVMTIPLVLDLVDGSFIWADLDTRSNSRKPNNAINNRTNLSLTVQSIVQNKVPSLRDLVVANAESRGELVDDAAEADTIITVKNGRLVVGDDSIGTDRILSEWL